MEICQGCDRRGECAAALDIQAAWDRFVNEAKYNYNLALSQRSESQIEFIIKTDFRDLCDQGK